jgi:hypothetical protein
MSGFDGAQGGIDFGSRLLSNVFALHRQDQDTERKQAEAQRESMLSILTAAANSGNVNPADMPTLLKTLFETASVKPDKKAIEAIGQHAQALFTQNTTQRPAPKRWQTTAIDEVPITNTAPIPQSPALPEVPTMMSGPAIRMMSPEEKAKIAIKAKVAERAAMEPFDLRKIQEGYTQKRLLQSERLSAQEQTELAKINARTNGAAQKRVTELAYAYEGAGYSPDDARERAGKDVVREFGAKVALTETKTAKQIADMEIARGRLRDAQARTGLMKIKTGAYVNRMQQLVATGAKEKSLVPVYNAMIRDLLPERTALQRMIIKLESDPNVDSEDEEVKADIANFKSRIAEIDAQITDAKSKFLPNSKVLVPNAFAGAGVNGDIIPAVPTTTKPKSNSRTYNVPLNKYGLQ